MARGKQGDACIVGVGQTEMTRWGHLTGRSELDLAVEAVILAAADAGLAVSAIDGIASFGSDRTSPQMLQYALGMPHLRLASLAWHPGGGGSCAAVQLAAMAVETGHCDYVVVIRSIQLDETRRFGRNASSRPHNNFNAPFGVFAPAVSFALVAQRHMHLFGTNQRHLAEVALTCRANAQSNPRAIMHGRPMTLEDYYASRPIAAPLRLYDCCLECDGANALIVTTRERARDLRQVPALLLASATGSERGMGYGAMGGHNMPDEVYATGNARSLAKDLFAKAGVRPEEIDVAQIYDAFTISVLLSLEDYGFVEEGGSGPFVEAGGIGWPNGTMPCNTSGGNLSEAYIQGLNHVIESVRQMRGTSTRQVNSASLGFVCGSSVETPTSALVMARG